MLSPSTMLQMVLIRFNNRLTRWRGVRVPPGRLLLLAARCLQAGVCGQNLSGGVDQCKACGRCPVKDLLDLRNRYGIRCVIASGGRQAVEAVKDPAVAAVVAVACEKELAEGISASFPKPVLAVCNTRPRGPCHDTQVEREPVEGAIRFFLEGSGTPAR